jgi:hypothetical protein
MQNIKLGINTGHWNFVNEIDDVNALIELCYDWLEDCVNFVINPEKIDNIFSGNEDFYTEIKNNIDNPSLLQQHKELRKKIVNTLKSELRMIEYETITCIADFTVKIYPLQSQENSQKEDFILMIEKIAIYCLGMTISKVFENNDKIQASKNLNIVQKLIDIILFMGVVIKYDMGDALFNPVDINRRNTISFNQENISLFLMRKQLEDFASSLSNSIGKKINGFYRNSFVSKRPNIPIDFLNSEMKKKNFNSLKNYQSINSNNNEILLMNCNNKESDSLLLDMYKKLQIYFQSSKNKDGNSEDMEISPSKITGDEIKIRDPHLLAELYETMQKLLGSHNYNGHYTNINYTNNFHLSENNTFSKSSGYTTDKKFSVIEEEKNLNNSKEFKNNTVTDNRIMKNYSPKSDKLEKNTNTSKHNYETQLSIGKKESILKKEPLKMADDKIYSEDYRGILKKLKTNYEDYHEDIQNNGIKINVSRPRLEPLDKEENLRFKNNNIKVIEDSNCYSYIRPISRRNKRMIFTEKLNPANSTIFKSMGKGSF